MKYIILLSSIFSLSFGQNTQMGKIEYTEYFGDHEKVNYSMSFSETFSIYEQNTINDDLLVTEGCAESAIRCIRRARSNAATGLALSAVSAWFNPIVGAAGALGSQIYLSNAFDACMGN
jgi:hypothetical protein